MSRTNTINRTIRLKNNRRERIEDLPDNLLSESSDQYVSIREVEAIVSKYDDLIKRYSDTSKNLHHKDKAKERVLNELVASRDSAISKLNDLRQQYQTLEKENERLRNETMKIKKVDPERIKKYLEKPSKVTVDFDEDECNRMVENLRKKYNV